MKGFGITFIDIDETLFHTFAKVRVVKDGAIVKELSNQEYNTYQLQEGESYDYAEFKDAKLFHDTSEPIPAIIARVRKMIGRIKETASDSRIILLTARKDLDDKETFLQTFREQGIDVDREDIIYIERTGNIGFGSIAEKKQTIMRHYLASGKFVRCRLIDDDIGNMDAFKALAKEFPAIKFFGLHAHNGKLEQVFSA